MQPLHEFIESNHPLAERINAYLRDQSSLFDAYISKTIGKSKRVVLIDTGWAGTSQQLLARSYPNFEWMDSAFGWMNDAWDKDQCGTAHGLVFNSETYDPARPETSIALHRHLIESLFEPNAPSVEELFLDVGTGRISGVGGDLMLHEQFDVDSDPNYSRCWITFVRDRWTSVAGFKATRRQLSSYRDAWLTYSP